MRSIKTKLSRALLRSVDETSGEGPSSEIVEGEGDRDCVGGLWEALGTLQYRFMLERGLEPHHVLLDVACGSLRAGARFIAYLDTGHYLGIEVLGKLIDAGVDRELGQKVAAAKSPELVMSDRFEFERFSKQPDFVIAQSLFAHLTGRDIRLCLRNLRSVAKPGTRFFASFFETHKPQANAEHSDPRGKFLYSREQMWQFGAEFGWCSRYIGHWNHPRDQRMFEYFI